MSDDEHVTETIEELGLVLERPTGGTRGSTTTISAGEVEGTLEEVERALESLRFTA